MEATRDECLIESVYQRGNHWLLWEFYTIYGGWWVAYGCHQSGSQTMWFSRRLRCWSCCVNLQSGAPVLGVCGECRTTRKLLRVQVFFAQCYVRMEKIVSDFQKFGQRLWIVFWHIVKNGYSIGKKIAQDPQSSNNRRPCVQYSTDKYALVFTLRIKWIQTCKIQKWIACFKVL